MSESRNSYTADDLHWALERVLCHGEQQCDDCRIIMAALASTGLVQPPSLQDALNKAKWACESYVNWYSKGMAHEAGGIAFDLVSALRLLMAETNKALPLSDIWSKRA